MQVAEIVGQAVVQVRQQAATWGLQGDLVLPEHSTRSTAADPSSRHTSRSHAGGFSAAGAADWSADGTSTQAGGARAVGDEEPPFQPLTHIPSDASRLHMNRTEEDVGMDGDEDVEVALMMKPPQDDIGSRGPAGGTHGRVPNGGRETSVAAADPAAKASRKGATAKPRPSLAARIAARASERASQGCAGVTAAAGAAGRHVRAMPHAAVDAPAILAAATSGGDAHACVSSEHAELMRDMALSLMEVHQRSKTSQVCPVRLSASLNVKQCAMI